MAHYVEVAVDTVRPEIRAAAEAGVEFAKQHLKLPNIEIRWFEFAPRKATKAWFRRPGPIFGTINQERPDHIRLWAGQGATKAGETAAHESFHLCCALNRQEKGLPMLADGDPGEDAEAAAFGQRYLDELGSAR